MYLFKDIPIVYFCETFAFGDTVYSIDSYLSFLYHFSPRSRK